MIRMSIQEAKAHLVSLREQHSNIKNSLDRADREYASYISGEIACLEKAIKEFEVVAT